jgi:hypothetical protein
MKINMTYDRIIGLVLLAFSIAMLFWIIPSEVEMVGGNVGPGMDPAFMPQCIAFLVGFLAILVILSRTPHKKEKIRLLPPRTVSTIAFFVSYIILTSLVGYLPASLVILPAYLWFFGARNWKIIVPLSIGFPVLLYLFFAKVMQVILPTGTFWG